MTRDLLHSKIEDLEKQGLEQLEEGACAYFTGGAGLSFCRMAFKSPMGTWLNNKIVHIPIVEHINNKLSDAVADVIPSGMRNGMNTVIDGYNKMSAKVEPMEKFVSTCVGVGKKVADTLFVSGILCLRETAPHTLCWSTAVLRRVLSRSKCYMSRY